MQDPILGPYSDPVAGLRSKPHRHKQGADIEEPPMMQSGGKTATNLGERASQLSLTFGVLSLINILVLGSWFFGIPTVILSVLGLQKAKEADSYGVVSLAGRILSWIAIAMLALGYVLIVWAWFNAK